MDKYTPPPQELEKWTKASEPLWNEWVKKMEGRGRPEAQEVLKAALELLKK